MDHVYENNGGTTKEVMGYQKKVWTILKKITENNKAKVIIKGKGIVYSIRHLLDINSLRCVSGILSLLFHH